MLCCLLCLVVWVNDCVCLLLINNCLVFIYGSVMLVCLCWFIVVVGLCRLVVSFWWFWLLCLCIGMFVGCSFFIVGGAVGCLIVLCIFVY